MAKINRTYRCNLCGNIVEVLHQGDGILVCCGQPMELLDEKTKDEGNEKHKPVIETTENGIKVKVGSVEHPMTEEHYIEWIEVQADGKTYIQHLTPKSKPEAEFCIKSTNVLVKAYCNKHGLWKV
jgi:superoxide reductase